MKSRDLVPNFIGIGAAKCATTWAYRCLLEHPQICGPYEKELNFFSTQDHPLFKNSEKKKKIIFSKGLNSYLEYFSHCSPDLIKGEFSTAYLSDPGSAKLIKANFPDVKIIAILRDPVKRAHSFYWFAKDFMMKERNLTFEDALEKNPLIYIDWGMYYKQLRPYFDLFPLENIGVFFVDDLKKDPVLFMQDIYEFLGADKKFVAPTAKKIENAASEVRFKFLRIVTDFFVDVLYRLKLSFIINILKKIGLQKAVHYFHYKINVKSAKKPKINSETEKKLRGIFREDIEKLEKLLNRDLSSWK